MNCCQSCGKSLEWVHPYVNRYEDDPETGRPYLACENEQCPQYGEVVRLFGPEDSLEYDPMDRVEQQERRDDRRVFDEDDEARRADEQDDRDEQPIEFTESDAGEDARDRWARAYDDLNGAPEGEWDR